MFFRAALKRKVISSNPFADVTAKAATSMEGERFVSPEETAQLLEACPNHDWRAIVALARYGGLRCPSDVLSLRWQGIDWVRERMIVTSPKTEHHPGKGSRVVPLFPEVRAVLEAAFDAAPEGAVYVVDERLRQSALRASGWRNCNLRIQFERVVKRAGLTPWRRLFHALRKSRETELVKAHPIHVVTTWLGNTPRIAMKHYLMVTEADFAAAVEKGAGGNPEIVIPAAQISAHSPSATMPTPSTTTKLPSPQHHVVMVQLGLWRRMVTESLAERTGFEPAEEVLLAHRFSKPALSTTQPPLRVQSRQ